MKKYLFIVLVFSLISSCNNNPVAPGNNNSFSLQLHVVDSNGNPVPNVNVSIHSEYTSPADTNGLVTSNSIYKVTNLEASTLIKIDIAQSCYVDLSYYNLDKQKMGTFFPVFQKWEAGTHLIDWIPYHVDTTTNQIPVVNNQAKKLKLIASSDSLGNHILYQDSIYLMIIPDNPKVGFIGRTDSNGNLNITNKLLFPQLYNLPAIPIMDVSGNQLGLFTYSDSTVITLSDQSFSKSISYTKVVKEGANTYTLTWSGAAPKVVTSGLDIYKQPISTVIRKITSDADSLNWKLYPCYPNPLFFR